MKNTNKKSQKLKNPKAVLQAKAAGYMMAAANATERDDTLSKLENRLKMLEEKVNMQEILLHLQEKTIQSQQDREIHLCNELNKFYTTWHDERQLYLPISD
jgi:hypothetical protein